MTILYNVLPFCTKYACPLKSSSFLRKLRQSMIIFHTIRLFWTKNECFAQIMTFLDKVCSKQGMPDMQKVCLPWTIFVCFAQSMTVRHNKLMFFTEYNCYFQSISVLTKYDCSASSMTILHKVLLFCTKYDCSALPEQCTTVLHKV